MARRRSLFSVKQIEGLSPSQSAFVEMVSNVLGSRKEFINQFLDPRRDIDEECGYPRTITLEQYQRFYDRHAVAARVVEVLPKETWKVDPEIYEDEDPEVETPFEKGWSELNRSIGVMPDYSDGQCGSAVMEAWKRADVLCGIGRYAVIVMGLDDGKPLDQPARVLDTSDPQVPRKILSLRVFPEILAQIDAFEDSKTSPRRGLPTYYNVAFSETATQSSRNVFANGQGSILPEGWERVHWSRCVHIVDNVLSSEVYGMPRCQQVFDELMDVKKVRGGSAEMYWKGAFPGLSVESHPGQGGEEMEFDEEATKGMMEDYMNGLQRYLALIGMTVKSIAPQVVDPTPQILSQIQSICIKLGIPLRIFMGSERGELSSAQDSAEWADRVVSRQKDQAIPRIVKPCINHWIWLGCLPRPKSVWKWWWPDMRSQTDKDKAQIAFQKTQALVQYVKGEGWRVVPPMQFLTLILGVPEKQAISIIKAAEDSGLFDLEKVGTSGSQNDYTNLGRGYGGQQGPPPNG